MNFKNIAIAITILHSVIVYAQEKVIKGKITDEQTGEVIVGAAIVETGTSNGTVSDLLGRFTIVIGQNSSITVSYVGYEPQEIANPDSEMNIEIRSSYDLESILIQGVRAAPTDPVAQTTLTKKSIEKDYRGQHPIFILDKLTPGIFSYSESGTSTGNYGQIRMRGIAQERINFTLNGVPLNDMIDQGVFFSNFSDISSSFESIQVQRGVGTSSNGVSSYAGSINFESINLKRSDPFSSVTLGGGSFNTFRANAQVNSGVNEDGFGLYSSISRISSDGFKDNTGTEATSFFISGGYFGEKDLIRLTAFAGRSENGLGYYTIDKSILDDDFTFNNLTENDRDDFSQYLIQLQHTRKLGPNSHITNTAYYGGAGGDFAEGTPDEDSVFVENYGAQYYTSFFSINYPLQNRHIGWITNYFYQTEKIEINTGIHFYRFFRENRESILPDDANPYYEDQTEKGELSFFARMKYNLSPNLSLFADGQLRNTSLEFFPDYEFIYGDDLVNILIDEPEPFSYTFFNPRVGINYQFNSRMNAFFSFGRSGREPTRIDLIGGFQLNENALNLLLSNDFEPEFVNDFEAGMVFNGQKFSIQANVFFMDFENEIAPIGEIIAFGVQRRENIEDSYRAGVEFAWNYLIGNTLSYSGTGSYMRSRIQRLQLGDEVINDVNQILSPEWITSQQINFIPGKKLDLGLTFNAMSESFMEYTNDPEFIVPSFFTMDFSFRYSILEKWTVDLSVNNILDREYYTFGAPSDVDFSGVLEPGYLIQPKRNFFISSTFKF